MRTNLGFGTLIREGYNYNSDIYALSDAWYRAGMMFYVNYKLNENNTPKIPKKIHQLWLGSKIPDKYKSLCESWRLFHPSWEYRLWTDADIDELGITRKDEFCASSNMGTRSDIMSYEILRKHGGLYVDTDFECLKPFDDLLYLKFFVGISYDAEFVLYHGLVASMPEHPIVIECIEKQEKRHDGNNGMAIMDATGPYHLTRCFNRITAKDSNDVVAFPFQFFYPLPNNKREEKSPYKYIEPYSYAIHHWHVSWLDNKK